ncbi:DNA polymerase Y family protein [Piscinibacter gummiphilus]|uniref:DNA polymerase Y family protein n=1 Tax=Piscinibacter gummiphilus TaxID=946333 RepID=A0ABZ0CPT5_9BURK|nr:DNA polymerase Y family protein [Piscinibacter gummiphilus]WOB06978.1 DNA polymerase Y family protein [Piscinibacter gummiphilus]
MLWVGVHLPLLSLESFAASLPQRTDQPMALVDTHLIASADAAAQALGVSVGMKRATALGLAPHLLLGQADAWRDAQALQGVAHAALAFTPMVCLDEPDGVLLEVQSSLRYFGGLAALLGRLRDALAPFGHRLQIVSAPTPHGAALLARLHDELHCPDRHTLQRALEEAPIGVMATGAPHEQTLLGMGLRCLGELRQLPRAGVARRFGKALLDEMDRAFGDRPDPREPLVLPPTFRSGLELFARADTTEQLLHGAQMLLLRLVAWLSAQHAFVTRFRLLMKHEARWRDGHTAPITPLEVALAEPSRDVAHMLTLLRERLAQMALPAPTLELAIESDDIVRRPPPNAELFPTPQSERAGLVQLIERLQARLGREQVQCLVPVADHRPERATQVVPADPQLMKRADAVGPAAVCDAAQPGRETLTRPLWLLPEPQALKERQSHPLLDGQLVQLLVGPERIETGWWDGGLAERDYFIGQTTEGGLVWVYRTRPQHLPTSRAPGWFLHGRFA